MPDLVQIERERLFERVQLVEGRGSRRKSRLCVMSFVALLAGERHTDAPEAASPLLRYFAMTLNDAMPNGQRQRLKLFAPRLIGTNDGHDDERARVLVSIYVDEILPKLRADFGEFWLSGTETDQMPEHVLGAVRPARDFFAAKILGKSMIPCGRDASTVAVHASAILTTCANCGLTRVDGDWYWAKAVDLLDRLCDVGPSKKTEYLTQVELQRATDMLDRQGLLERVSIRMCAILPSLRRKVRPLKPIAFANPLLPHASGTRALARTTRGTKAASTEHGPSQADHDTKVAITPQDG